MTIGSSQNIYFPDQMSAQHTRPTRETILSNRAIQQSFDGKFILFFGDEEHSMEEVYWTE